MSTAYLDIVLQRVKGCSLAILWDFVKKTGKKLDYSTGNAMDEAMDGSKCKDRKYYMFSHSCLLLKGTLEPEPEMICAFIAKDGNGVEV